MNAHGARGSTELLTRLFDAAPSDADLQEALKVAREEYRVLRWWKLGQPAVDAIKVKLDIPQEKAGGVLTDLVQMHSEKLQVTVNAFPYGLPALDGVLVDVTMERQVAG